MSEEKTTAPPAKQTTAPKSTTAKPLPGVVELTKADAASAVSRHVPVRGKDGKPTGKMEAVVVAEDEVLDFAVRGSIVTVITVDGQRLTGAL
ncbi:hypothetical protein [Azonexus sp.]|uniref:hypothetical protein n=1 Tax=Azonexus sp. TaxID=1872668 RepID=UPI0028394733|nr:hypothetical protein [Azonexus sp.]MDR1995141.1 hypothetical protein [Azonexus sp.]